MRWRWWTEKTPQENWFMVLLYANVVFTALGLMAEWLS
jgi:hypothetical protein